MSVLSSDFQLNHEDYHLDNMLSYSNALRKYTKNLTVCKSVYTWNNKAPFLGIAEPAVDSLPVPNKIR